MEREAIAMLVTGLAGGFGHCIGMCGPIVAAYSLGEARQGVLHHLLYNLGRVTTYTILGAIVGLSGSFLVLATTIDLLQTTIMALAGLAIIIMGIASAGWLPFGKALASCGPLMPSIRKMLSLFNGTRSIGAYFPMGVLLGFLPCGLTWTALLTAARTAMEAPDHVSGMLRAGGLMLLFGLGTTPALLLVGKAIRFLGERTRLWFHRLAALVMVATGLWFLVGAFSM